MKQICVLFGDSPSTSVSARDQVSQDDGACRCQLVRRSSCEDSVVFSVRNAPVASHRTVVQIGTDVVDGRGRRFSTAALPGWTASETFQPGCDSGLHCRGTGHRFVQWSSDAADRWGLGHTGCGENSRRIICAKREYQCVWFGKRREEREIVRGVS